MLKEPKFLRNQTLLKEFGLGENKKLKLIKMSMLRNSGVEDDDSKVKLAKGKGTKNTEKLKDNISRARRKVFELAFCNPWQFSFTGTLDPKKYERTDLEKYHKDFTQWIRNYNKKHGTDIKFLIVPELHSDGIAWHFHGFLHGLPMNHTHKFVIGDKMSKSIANKVLNGMDVYFWMAYNSKFGFSELEPIYDEAGITDYMTKNFSFYITEELSKSVSELNAQMYYHSRGLQFATLLAKGYFDGDLPDEPTYSGDYCDVYWLDYSEDKLQELLDGFVRPHATA